MLWIPLNLRSPPVLNSNQHPASVGTIVRTHGMNNLLHPLDYTVRPKESCGDSPNKKNRMGLRLSAMYNLEPNSPARTRNG